MVFSQESCMDVRAELYRKLSTEELMLLNCGVGEDSWESLGLQGDPTSPFWRRSVLNIHWKDWCWSWSSNALATWWEELTHWKKPWCWERLKAGGEGDNRRWDGWMASLTRWTWVWASSRSWRWTGRPGVLQSMGLQRVRHDWATELRQDSRILLLEIILWGVLMCIFVDLCRRIPSSGSVRSRGLVFTILIDGKCPWKSLYPVSIPTHPVLTIYFQSFQLLHSNKWKASKFQIHISCGKLLSANILL